MRSLQPNVVENLAYKPTRRFKKTSEDTLVGPWDNTTRSTKVTLTDETTNKTYDNLIELETEGPSKTFFDPETGEFIQITP